MPQDHIQWKHICNIVVFHVLLTLIFATFAFSWGGVGHKIVNGKAVMQLPASMASFKLDSMYFVNGASDADGRKNYSDTSFYAEHLRHYIDIDIYPNFQTIPHSLDSMIVLYGRSYVRSVGTLPWAIVMTLDSLTAQLRRGDIALAESTMADLGHYVGDAHQPLHNTENYDGDMTGNNGIHSRYETSMINKFQTSVLVNFQLAQYVTSPLDYAFEFILHSNSLVDSVLEADNYAKSATGWSGTGSPPSAYYDSLWKKTSRFTKEQFQNGSVALASLWYTAWVNSQTSSNDSIIVQSFGNGTVTPSGTILVQTGTNKSFSFTPQTGYHVDSVYVDGVKVDSMSGYTFHAVTTNHTISVWFGINLYTISASAGIHGTVFPTGDITVAYNTFQSFSFLPDSGYTVDSLFVDGVYVDSLSGFTFTSVHQHHSLLVTFKTIPAILHYSVLENWNMVSVPLALLDSRKNTMFPSAISPAFEYNQGYQAKDSLKNGHGYWLKFDSDQSLNISGTIIDKDTITVNSGWNMIGSISDSVDISCIVPIGTAIQSQYFAYQNGYIASDSILPGKAYWVKVSSAGYLVLQHCTVGK